MLSDDLTGNSTSNSSKERSDFPSHLPVEMALAPQDNPYRQKISTRNPGSVKEASQKNPHGLAQHTLSPEKLGVTGYVKDVAGFVKDVIYQVWDKPEKNEDQEDQHTNKLLECTSDVLSPQEIPISNSPTHPKSPLVETVISLFPGVGSPHIPGCDHADMLRNDLRTHNGVLQNSSTRPF
ncbi:hypothetical protein BDF14DRAFT_1809530 [Spinellus fusiger]|nr:hypothetical protein BDF14DRAFT_1809530 [Spinellus fusiger]